MNGGAEYNSNMKILIFTEGTILIFGNAKGVSREEAVKQSKIAVISDLFFRAESGSPHDFKGYVPNGKTVEKLFQWKKQGITIFYLTSRRIKKEIKAIKSILKRFNFPDSDNLYFRNPGEDYKDVAQRLVPDIIIEDDCESIGGEKEMTYPHISGDLKKKIKSIVVKEFEGIDHLPDKIEELINY